MERLVRQHRYIQSVRPVCGTNDLGTCVGVAIMSNPNEGEWFIAHIDCAAQVKDRTDEMFNRVSKYVENRLTELLGPCVSKNVHVISSLTDHSSQAVHQGVTNWAKPTTKVQVRGWYGFKITEKGEFEPLSPKIVNNDNGDGEFTVPDNT